MALEAGSFLGVAVDSFHGDGLSLNRTSYQPDQLTGAVHFHQNAHISLVLQGGNVERRRSAQLERTPGCVTFYHAQEPHQTIQKQFPAQHINLELDESFLEHFGIAEEQLRKGIQATPDCAITILKLYREFQQNDCFSPDSLGMLVGQMLNERLTDKTPSWVRTINELMQDRWNESVTLAELAAAAGVHPVTISRYFPRYFGATMGEYMRKLRVTKAIALIKSGPATLTDIAYQCGFSDQSHFTRTFQHLTGLAPKQFREL